MRLPMRLLLVLSFVGAFPLLAWASTGATTPVQGVASAVFRLLAREPFLALFLALGFGHLLGRLKVRGFTLGSTASTLLVALVLSAVGYSWVGVRFDIPDLVQTTALTLFLYAVGLRVGPLFMTGLREEGVHLILLTLLTATLNFLMVWGGSLAVGLAPGFAAGMIAGGYNVTAAMGVATDAVKKGAYHLPPGVSADQVIANIAAGYSLTYVFSLLGIVLLMVHLPAMFGFDPVASAKKSEEKFTSAKDPLPGTGEAFAMHTMVRGGVRVFKLANQQFIGHPVHEVFERLDTPVLRLERQGVTVPLIDNPRLKAGDLLTVAGKLQNLIGEYVSLGPEVADEDARHLGLEQAEIVLTQPAFDGKTLEEFHDSPPAYGVRVRALFRAGHELSLLPAIKLQKGDVLRVLGPKICIGRAVKALGRAVYPSDATSIITLALGAAFGYMVGLLSVSIGGVPIGLGTPAGVILAGIAVATLRTLNPSWGGPVPEATRDFLETIGLDLFVGGLGLNVAPSLVKTLSQGRSVVLVLVIGLLAALIPPFISWLVGLYVFKMDPIFLAGAVAGSRSSTTAMKALQDETKSSIPALGYPVPYALAAVVVLIYAYLAMLFS